MNLKNLLQNIINDRDYKVIATVTSSSPVQLYIPNLARGLVQVISGSSTRTALYSVYCTSTGGVYAVPIGTAGSSITIDTATTNVLKITSSSSTSAYVAWIGNKASEVRSNI